MLTPHLYVQQVPWLERGADVTVPRAPVPVTAHVHWQDGHTSEHTGTATAWTSRAVEVRVIGEEYRAYTVWLAVGDVRRR